MMMLLSQYNQDCHPREGGDDIVIKLDLWVMVWPQDVGVRMNRVNHAFFFLGRYKSVIVPSNISAAWAIVSDSVGWG